MSLTDKRDTMSNTGPSSVVEVKDVDSVTAVAERVVDFWTDQLMIYGSPYRRSLHMNHKKSRAKLRSLLRGIVESRLVSMMERDSGDQWFINHLAEPYPPFLRALRESAIPGASWLRNSSTSIVYREGAFDVRTRQSHKGVSTEHHRRYQIKSPA